MSFYPILNEVVVLFPEAFRLGLVFFIVGFTLMTFARLLAAFSAYMRS